MTDLELLAKYKKELAALKAKTLPIREDLKRMSELSAKIVNLEIEIGRKRR